MFFFVYEILLFVQSLWDLNHTYQKEKEKTKYFFDSYLLVQVSEVFLLVWTLLFNEWVLTGGKNHKKCFIMRIFCYA